MTDMNIEAFEARAAEAEERLADLERERKISSGTVAIPDQIVAVLQSIKADLIQAKGEHTKLRSENEQLSTEVAKQKYRVDKHILPYVEQLRNENSKLKAALAEQQSSGGVEGVSKGVSGLSLS